MPRDSFIHQDEIQNDSPNEEKPMNGYRISSHFDIKTRRRSVIENVLGNRQINFYEYYPHEFNRIRTTFNISPEVY